MINIIYFLKSLNDSRIKELNPSRVDPRVGKKIVSSTNICPESEGEGSRGTSLLSSTRLSEQSQIDFFKDCHHLWCATEPSFTTKTLPPAESGKQTFTLLMNGCPSVARKLSMTSWTLYALAQPATPFIVY